jgi:hypothetical protein
MRWQTRCVWFSRSRPAKSGGADACANAIVLKLAHMRERERRAAKRALERGAPVPGRLLGAGAGGGAGGAGGDSDEDGSGFEDSDDEEDGEGDDGEGADERVTGTERGAPQPRSGPASAAPGRVGRDDESAPPGDADLQSGSDPESDEAS